MSRSVIAALIMSVILWTGTLLHDSFESHELGQIAFSEHEHAGSLDSAPSVAVEEHWHGPYCGISGDLAKSLSEAPPADALKVTSVDLAVYVNARLDVEEFLGRPPPDLIGFPRIPTYILLSVMLT